MDCLIKHNFVVDHDHGCKQLVFGITIILIRGNVRQPYVGLSIDFHVKNVTLDFVEHRYLDLEVGANQDDWPHFFLVQSLAFDCGVVLTHLDFSKLRQLVVGDN